MKSCVGLFFGTGALVAATVASQAAPIKIGDVYQEYISDTCTFATCFVDFTTAKKPLKIASTSCYISFASASDIAINRVAIGQMAANGNFNSFESLALLAPVTMLHNVNGTATYQFNVPVLVATAAKKRPAIYIEFTRDTASFLKCSIAGSEIK